MTLRICGNLMLGLKIYGLSQACPIKSIQNGYNECKGKLLLSIRLMTIFYV